MENLCEVKISITKGRKENKGPLVISRVAPNRAIHGHQARSRAYLCHSVMNHYQQRWNFPPDGPTRPNLKEKYWTEYVICAFGCAI